MLIGLLGLAGSGKDTVAKIMREKHVFHRRSFASKLKDITSTLFDWDRHLLEGDTLEGRSFRDTISYDWSDSLNIRDFTPRKALQLLGTEVFRNSFHKDIWVLSTLNNLPEKTVISDVRFMNEVRAIEKLGIVIRVMRGSHPEWWDTAIKASRGCIKSAHLLDTYYKIHRSEWDTAHVETDFIIHNDGSIKDLEDSVKNILSYL